MSLNKAILHGKEHRKPYQGTKVFLGQCRNHGKCTYCLSNRLHSINVQKEKADFSEKEFKESIDNEG